MWLKINSIKFHSEPVYDKTYFKVKVREFDGKIKANFLGNGMPKENMHYTCIACITIDSVMIIDEKNTNGSIHKHWTKIRFRARFRSRFKIWRWINGKTKIWYRTMIIDVWWFFICMDDFLFACF